MSNQITKCIRCGAPIDWSKSMVTRKCEYCGQPLSQISQYFVGIKESLSNIISIFSYISFSSKEKINTQKTIFLKKQKILSDKQITSIENNINRVFRKKRNIFILLALPVSFFTYLKVNYPETAKPFYPELPYQMPVPEETGEFIFYAKKNTKENLASLKYWCPLWRKSQSLKECLKSSREKNTKYYFDKGSETKKGNWFVYKMASSNFDKEPSTDGKYDAAINCKKGLITFYQTAGISKYYEMKSRFPSQFGLEEKEQYERRKPTSIQRKMGKLWWLSDDVANDLENGQYLAWHKQQVKYQQERLKEVSDKNYCPYREGFKHKCTAKSRLESINTSRSVLKSSKESLVLRQLWRKEGAVQNNKLFKAVCKRGPLGFF